MSPILTIVLIIVVLVIIAAVVYGVQQGRRKRLQNTFGPEYDRAVADTGSRSEAEKELREREKRHAELTLKPLSAESQARYSAAWEEVQIQFVDNPSEAVTTADELVTRLITERGYPTADYDDRLADLSVEHASTLQNYRDAHAISERNTAGEASTEDLRQALVHYRSLFADLLGTDPVQTPATTETVTTESTSDTAASDTAAVSRGAGSGTVDDTPVNARDDADATRAGSSSVAPAPREAVDDTTTATETTR
jgi:hypothetical protein